MTPGGLALSVLVVLMIGNRLVLRFALRGPQRWLYWVIQGGNLTAVIYLLVIGMPGLPHETRIMDWALALLFMWHIAENHLRRR